MTNPQRAFRAYFADSPRKSPPKRISIRRCLLDRKIGRKSRRSDRNQRTSNFLYSLIGTGICNGRNNAHRSICRCKKSKNAESYRRSKFAHNHRIFSGFWSDRLFFHRKHFRNDENRKGSHRASFTVFTSQLFGPRFSFPFLDDAIHSKRSLRSQSSHLHYRSYRAFELHLGSNVHQWLGTNSSTRTEMSRNHHTPNRSNRRRNLTLAFMFWEIRNPIENKRF